MSAKHTQGPVGIKPRHRPGESITIRTEKPHQAMCDIAYVPHHGAFSEANADLIAEAFNVATETGMTPREILNRLAFVNRLMDKAVAQRAELLAALELAEAGISRGNGIHCRSKTSNGITYLGVIRGAIAKATGASST